MAAAWDSLLLAVDSSDWPAVSCPLVGSYDSCICINCTRLVVASFAAHSTRLSPARQGAPRRTLFGDDQRAVRRLCISSLLRHAGNSKYEKWPQQSLALEPLIDRTPHPLDDDDESNPRLSIVLALAAAAVPTFGICAHIRYTKVLHPSVHQSAAVVCCQSIHCF